MTREILTFFALFLLTIPASWNLTVPGGFTSHDLTHHVVRQVSMDKIFNEGQFPPRWSGELNRGYGHPLFLFNYPLPALLGEVFIKLGLGYLDSVKAVMIFSFVASVLGMYLFLKELLDLRSAAFLGALFYLYAPIRFLNVYVSAAVGSALALAFIPLIFYAIVKIAKGGGWFFVILGSLSLASLILSHNTTALMFAPLILIFMVLMFFKFKVGREFIIKSGLMLVLGVGLSGWFWLPALAEKQYTRYDLVMGNFYKDHFPTLSQLIYSPWGFGFSNPGPNDGLSFQIGLAHILAVLLLLLVMLTRYKVKNFNLLSGFALLGFFISIFLMLDVSLPFWEKLPLLNYVIYPPRFLVVAVFCASIASALVIRYLPLKTFFFFTLLILVLYANRNHLGVNQRTFYPNLYYESIKDSGTSFAEHLPKWAKEPETDSFGKLTVLGGQVNVLEDRSSRVVAEVIVDKDSRVKFNQFYFPGWQVKVDGRVVDLNYQDDGLPTFKVSSGRHKVLAEFKNTPVRDIADLISIVSLLGLPGITSIKRKTVIT